MKKFLILVFFLSGGVLADTPKSEITGAFGLKLGDTFDKKLAISDEDLLIFGIRRFAIDPPKKVRALNKYSVWVTPITNKIYGIFGTQTFNDESQCLNELNIYKESLGKKYGEFKRRDSNEIIYEYDFGSRWIILRCEYYVSSTLSIGYGDEELHILSMKEQQEKELGKGGKGDM